MGAQPRQSLAQREASSPAGEAFKAYGSGAPKWLGLVIYLVFFAIAVAALAPQVIHPYRLKGLGGFLIAMMDKYLLILAAIAAFAVWRSLTWRLRGRYPDKLLASADYLGISLPTGITIPYADIRRIDPCSRGSRMGADNWIEIDAGQLGRWKIDVNMSVDPPEQILAELRERALNGGANLAPELPNGRLPTVGTQLGYRVGRGWQG
jgi:hypothetical protein